MNNNKLEFASEQYINEKAVPVGPKYDDGNLPKPREDRLDGVDPVGDITNYVHTVTRRIDIDAVFDRLDAEDDLKSTPLRRGVTYILENCGIVDPLDEAVEDPFDDEVVEEVKSKSEEKYRVDQWDENGAKDLVAEYLDRRLDVVERRHGDHRDLDHFVRMMENYWAPTYDNKINAEDALG